MVSVNISYFDEQQGPTSLYSIPSIDPEVEDKVASFIDSLYSEGWTEFSMEGFYSQSYFFEIPSPIARGKKELILVSVIRDRSEDKIVSREIILEAVNKIKAQDKVYYAFHDSHNKFYNQAEYQNANKKLEKIMGELFDKINITIQEQKSGTIIVMGLDKAGKTTLIRTFKENLFSPSSKPTLGFQILKIALGNLDLLVVDAPGHRNLRDRWWSFKNKVNAIIYVVDIAESLDRMDESQTVFKEMLENFYSERKDIPLLIIGNKVDLVEKNINKEFVLNHLVENFTPHLDISPFYFELMSSKTGEGIQKGFRWLIGEIIKL